MAGHLRIILSCRGGPFKYERSTKAPQQERKGGILAKVPHQNRHFKVPIVYFFKNKEQLFVVKELIFNSTQKTGKSKRITFSVFLVWEKTALKFRLDFFFEISEKVRIKERIIVYIRLPYKLQFFSTRFKKKKL